MTCLLWSHQKDQTCAPVRAQRKQELLYPFNQFFSHLATPVTDAVSSIGLMIAPAIMLHFWIEFGPSRSGLIQRFFNNYLRDIVRIFAGLKFVDKLSCSACKYQPSFFVTIF
jgi:hypothetical protein